MDGVMQMMTYAASDELDKDVLDKVQGGVVATIFKYVWKAIKYIVPKVRRAGKKLANWEHIVCIIDVNGPSCGRMFFARLKTLCRVIIRYTSWRARCLSVF